VDQDSSVEEDAVLPHFLNRSVVGIPAAAADVGIVVSVVHHTTDRYCDEVTVLPPQHHLRGKETRTNFPWFLRSGCGRSLPSVVGFDPYIKCIGGLLLPIGLTPVHRTAVRMAWYWYMCSNPGFQFDPSEASGLGTGRTNFCCHESIDTRSVVEQ
jgi:hypothetical protein